MLCLSGVELYSRWVPLFDVTATSENLIQGFLYLYWRLISLDIINITLLLSSMCWYLYRFNTLPWVFLEHSRKYGRAVSIIRFPYDAHDLWRVAKSEIDEYVKCTFCSVRLLYCVPASSSGASFFAWQRRARKEWLVMNRKGRQAKRLPDLVSFSWQKSRFLGTAQFLVFLSLGSDQF